jgi:hypothetical protein
MHRRSFLSLLGTSAAVWPLGARAQQPDDRVRLLLRSILRLQAETLAGKVGQFIREIESQIGWTLQLPWSAGTIDQRRFDGLRLLRQVPAITELAQLDPTGKEQLRVSRLAMDVIRPETDYSKDPKFTEAVAKKVYYGPVYFRDIGPLESRVVVPDMTLSLAGTRRDAGVSVAEVNLAPIQDLVSSTKVGERGLAYVVDAQNRVIAHSDGSVVQRDFSNVAQVQTARAGRFPEAIQVVRDSNGRDVLAIYTTVEPLGWLIFVELPVAEANAPAP